MAISDTVRKYMNLPTGMEEAQEERAAEAISIYKFCAEAKRRREYEWFINDNFYNNNHYLKYNVGTRQVQQIPMSKLGDKLTINKVAQVVRGISAFLNKEHPSVAVMPGIAANEALNRAKKEKHLCDYWYDHLQMNRKIKEITLDGCKYGIGWAKIIWDGDALAPTEPYTMSDGEVKGTLKLGDVMFARVDPFEIYPDPIATSMDNMRYIVHALPRTIGEIKNNKHYMNRDKLTPDNKAAASPIKQAQIRQALVNGASQSFTPQNLPDLNTLIVLETFKREFNKEAQKWEIRVITATNTGVLLRDEVWPFPDFPFEYYQTDIASGVMGSYGVIRNIREINRALNQQASQVLESSRVMGRLNWLAPRGANIGVINDTTGQYIEYDPNPGGAPTQTHPSQLPAYIQENMASMERWMDDIAGAHNAFNGNAPFSRASGTAVAKLQEGDSNGLSMMRDNLDDFLVRCFKKMLRTAKPNYTEARSLRVNERDGVNLYRWINIKGDDISTEDDLQVRSGTNMPYSLSDKQDMFMGMWKEKLITDPSVILRYMELPDIDVAINGNDEQNVDRQLQENRDLIAGKQLADPVIAENHSTHIRVIDELINNESWRKLSVQVQGTILDHRAKHIDLSIQLAKISASLQFEPIKRSEQINYRMNSMNEATPIERTQVFEKFGVNSDAAQIQQRGGLFVQNPEDARQQAMLEDNEMMVDPKDPTEMSKPMMISPGDNHQVHLTVHSEAVGSPGFKLQPRHAQDFMTSHIKQHEMALQTQMTAPGLIPNEHSSLPTQPAVAKRPQAPENPQHGRVTGPLRTEQHPAITAANNDQQRQMAEMEAKAIKQKESMMGQQSGKQSMMGKESMMGQQSGKQSMMGKQPMMGKGKTTKVPGIKMKPRQKP